MGHALVDNIVGHLCQAIDIGFAGTIVAAFHRVVEQTIDGVAVVLVVLGGIDTTLRGNGVGAAGRILNAEVNHVEAHLAECGGGRSTRKTCTDNDYVQFQLILGVHQTLVSFIVSPFLGHGAFGYSGI